MSKKNKPIETDSVQEMPAIDNVQADTDPVVGDVCPEHTQNAEPRIAKPAYAKKRIRVRKKAAKHLSVAVLCTNPQIRRFI